MENVEYRLKSIGANHLKKRKFKNLDCLLISPPFLYKYNEDMLREVHAVFPPMGLASIAAYIRDKGHSVKILDCNIDSPSIELFSELFEKEFVQNFLNINVIGITSVTANIKKAYKIAEICKKFYPKVKIVLGGTHATALANEVLGNEFIDIVVNGEGEITFEEIISGKNLRRIKGIFFKKILKNRFKIIKTSPRERINNLDSLPIPAFDLLPILRYKPAIGTYKRLPAINVITSRGCPGKCTYCSQPLGKKVVFKSAKKIFEEIQYLIQNYGIKEIIFYDDVLTLNKNNTIELCNLFIKNKVDISWCCFTRIDFIDFETLKKMKQSGCHQIVFGVESFDKKILKNINKQIDPKKIANVVNWSKKIGIDCRLSFMVGNPGDTKEVIKNNIKILNKLNPDLMQVTIATPFPGTDMFKWAKKNNFILTYNWDDYIQSKPIMQFNNLTFYQIKRLYKLMYLSFYFRPAFILKKLFAIRSVNDVRLILRGLNALISFFASPYKLSRNHKNFLNQMDPKKTEQKTNTK